MDAITPQELPKKSSSNTIYFIILFVLFTFVIFMSGYALSLFKTNKSKQSTLKTLVNPTDSGASTNTNTLSPNTPGVISVTYRLTGYVNTISTLPKNKTNVTIYAIQLTSNGTLVPYIVTVPESFPVTGKDKNGHETALKITDIKKEDGLSIDYYLDLSTKKEPYITRIIKFL